MTSGFKQIITVIATAVLLSGSISASALELRIDPLLQDAAPSDVVAVDLVAAALGGDEIGVYEVILSYDPAALTLNSFQVSGALGSIPTQAIDISFGEIEPGTINLGVLSLLSTSELAAIQGAGPLVLGTLEFSVDVLAAGTSTFVYIDSINSLVGDGDAIEIAITSTMAGRIQHSDPDVIADAVMALPIGVFSNNADPAGQRNAIMARLADIEQDILDGNIAGAIRALRNLHRHVDGCLPMPDHNDWITDCAAQLEIQMLIDSLIMSLSA